MPNWAASSLARTPALAALRSSRTSSSLSVVMSTNLGRQSGRGVSTLRESRVALSQERACSFHAAVVVAANGDELIVAGRFGRTGHQVVNFDGLNPLAAPATGKDVCALVAVAGEDACSLCAPCPRAPGCANAPGVVLGLGW